MSAHPTLTGGTGALLAALPETGRYVVAGCGDELVTATLDVAIRDVQARLAELCLAEFEADPAH